MKLLDTGFLIDLQREAVSGATGPAHDFLRAHRDEAFILSSVTVWQTSSSPQRVLWAGLKSAIPHIASGH